MHRYVSSILEAQHRTISEFSLQVERDWWQGSVKEERAGKTGTTISYWEATAHTTCWFGFYPYLISTLFRQLRPFTNLSRRASEGGDLTICVFMFAPHRLFRGHGFILLGHPGLVSHASQGTIIWVCGMMIIRQYFRY